jgi:Xaa-Pro aminopeptidase
MNGMIERTRFQSFTEEAEPERAAERLAALRQRLRAAGVAAFVLTRSDPWQNEYLRACDERLAWLTGFTGSAGLVVVFADETRKAALFVDGRYTLQARRQVREDLFEILQVPETRPAEWLAARLAREDEDDATEGAGAALPQRPEEPQPERAAGDAVPVVAELPAGEGPRVGFDPWLMSDRQASRWEKTLRRRAGARLVPMLPDPVDAIWRERPAAPRASFFLQPDELAGRTVAEKLEIVRARLAERRVTAALITLADSVSWLFNLRGADIPHTPVALAFAWVPISGPALVFAEPEKVTGSVRAALREVAEFVPLEKLEERLRQAAQEGARVLVDREHAARHLVSLIEAAGAEIVGGEDPCLLPKATKTEAEQAGMRAAHVRDGVALCRFLAWLAREAPKGGVDEIGAVAALEKFRIETAEAMGEPLFDISFDTISGTGPNGAIVHYRVTRQSCRRLVPGELYLVDSGGQYRDGTTDVTRTVFIGGRGLRPRPEMVRHFTLVLKGMIALSMVRFPEGTSGANLDVLARRALWAAGLDYDHGTGHGVGAFLCVHEGPQRIARTANVAFRPGMITSNEPGYYREGHYGIRIENLVLCRPAERREGEERAMLSFETLTLAPIDRRLIDPALLEREERAWLDAYHARVLQEVGPHLARLDPEAARWLEEACAPLDAD